MLELLALIGPPIAPIVAPIPVVGPILALASLLGAGFFSKFFGGGGGGGGQTQPFQMIDPVTGQPPNINQTSGLNDRYNQELWQQASPQQAEKLGFNTSGLSPEQYIDPDWGIPKWVVTRLETVANPSTGTRWIDILKAYPLFTTILGPELIDLLNKPYDPNTDYNYELPDAGTIATVNVTDPGPPPAVPSPMPQPIFRPLQPPVAPPLPIPGGFNQTQPAPPAVQQPLPVAPPPIAGPVYTPEGGIPTFSTTGTAVGPGGGFNGTVPVPPAVQPPLPTAPGNIPITPAPGAPVPPPPPAVQAPMPTTPTTPSPTSPTTPNIPIPTAGGGGGGGSAIPPAFPVVGSTQPGASVFARQFAQAAPPPSLGQLLTQLFGRM